MGLGWACSPLGMTPLYITQLLESRAHLPAAGNCVECSCSGTPYRRYLHDNAFSGTLPASWSNLTLLGTL
jgi:hypothetical protein